MAKKSVDGAHSGESRTTSFAEFVKRSAASVITDEQQEHASYGSALAAIRNREDPPEHRIKAIEKFFVLFKVHRPHSIQQRVALAQAVIRWADQRQEGAPLAFEQIPVLLLELEQACRVAYGGQRRFTSLASKVLWLRFPDSVPIYDANAVAGLQVLVKLESGIIPYVRLEGEVDETYSAFLHYWRELYSRYEGLLDQPLNEASEPRPPKVKIFDRLLWRVGNPVYE